MFVNMKNENTTIDVTTQTTQEKSKKMYILILSYLNFYLVMNESSQVTTCLTQLFNIYYTGCASSVTLHVKVLCIVHPILGPTWNSSELLH